VSLDTLGIFFLLELSSLTVSGMHQDDDRDRHRVPEGDAACQRRGSRTSAEAGKSTEA